MKKSMTTLAIAATLALAATVTNAAVHPTIISAPQTVKQATASIDTPFSTQQKAGEIQTPAWPEVALMSAIPGGNSVAGK